MTREEFDKWSYERCPGGPKHEGNDDWGYWKSDCHECQWELLQSEIAKERERCADLVRAAKEMLWMAQALGERSNLKDAASAFGQSAESVGNVLKAIVEGE